VSSDEVIRIARAELERDTYKQAWQECQKSFDNIKWVIQVALTAIGLILAIFGLVLFKNTKEFKEAVADARKACEKAEEWEEKARAAFEKIDIRVENKLKEIDERVKIKLEQIQTEGNKSLVDILNERQISDLWKTASKLDDEGKYEEACEKYAELIKIKPNYYQAHSNYGNALYKRAVLKGNEELFKEACDKYARAIEIKSDEYTPYTGWGDALFSLAKLKKDTPEYKDLLNQSEGKLLKAESLKSGCVAYRLACIYALKNDKENCKKWLLIGQEARARTWVTMEHAMKDSDLDSVRNEQWFKAIKWKGEK